MDTTRTVRRKPRVLIVDIEILADMEEARVRWFGLGDWPGKTLKANVNSVICFGWKVLGERHAHCVSAWDYPRRWHKDINDDEQVVREAHKILQTADGIITQNGRKFDMPFLNSRFIKWGLAPLDGKLLHVDTKIVARRLFLSSNSLEELARFLDVEGKMKHEGKELWVRVSKREARAQDIMTQYCRQDVQCLEQVFLKLRSLCKDLPNWNLFSDEPTKQCPNCGHAPMQKAGPRPTKGGIAQRHFCLVCGTYATTKKDGVPKV